MLLTQILAMATFFSASVSALPNLDAFARDVENKIYARQLAEMGLTRHEDHPEPDLVAREVEHIVRNTAPKLLSRMPMIYCPNRECEGDKECQDLSMFCRACVFERCSAALPPNLAPNEPKPEPNDYGVPVVRSSSGRRNRQSNG